MSCRGLAIAIFIISDAVSFFSCRQRERQALPGFVKIPVSISGLDFQNDLLEDEDFNIIEYLYFYNGGGVAIGDVNNDGLPDIYFSSNQRQNRLFLNKGHLVFEDITDKAGVGGDGNWKTGVTFADVNGDGFLDIFSCGVGQYKKFNGRNQLFINKGDLTFSDETEAYGLSFHGFSTHASFFDYDNDGDLDMYLLNHSVHSNVKYSQASLRLQRHPTAGDRLYRNDLIPGGEKHFTDVTEQAGILSSEVAYGLGVGVSDLNHDGFPDIYISNDFRENDYLYINQRNGTFIQSLEACIPHTSKFSMGNDIADVNNDGWNDIVTLDMLPKDESIIKTTAGDDPYDIYEYKLQFGYHPQLSRNTLQLNHGVTDNGNLFFSDIAPFAGVEATDWSWAPLIADFDNDGFKDLFVANGIARRPNDLDYINFIYGDSTTTLSDKQFVEKMPSGAVPNIIYRNAHDLTFKDVSQQWLGDVPSISNGAAYCDLDADGDLDIVTNNINEEAFLYRNDLPLAGTNFLKFRLHGSRANRFGVGTRVCVYAGGREIHLEQIPSRGWQSSVDYVMHAGLGASSKADSIELIWPGYKTQILYGVKAGQTIDVYEKDAMETIPSHSPAKKVWALTQRPDSLFRHRENPFISFNTERLMPHMLTTQGPKISVGDVNGDGLSDFFIGGAAGQQGEIFMQAFSGSFVKSVQPALARDSYREDVGSALFDADGDGDADLLVAAGGQEFSGHDPRLLPALYVNDGKGHFTKSAKGLPKIFADASCIVPADVDGDGDLDVFIGGRVVTGKYGLTPSSYLLINNGHGVFSDEGRRWFRSSGYPGMVSDAKWLDLNGDKKLDLVLVGEWMAVTVLMQSSQCDFIDKTTAFGLADTSGWWNTLEADDMDNDGDIDLMVGNIGLNSRLRASVQHPVSILIRDIDNNGSLDPILTYYNGDREYPFITRDQLVKQVPGFKTKYLRYESFRHVSVNDLVAAGSSGYIKHAAKLFASVYLENTGRGRFIVRILPAEAQLFPIFSMKTADLNGDGNMDILAVGNLTAAQPDIGRYDSGYGLALLGDGSGGFEAVDSRDSGFIVPGEGRDVESVKNEKNQKIYLVARNNDGMLVFR